MYGKYIFSNGKTGDEKTLDKILLEETLVESSGDGNSYRGNDCHSPYMGQDP